MHYPPLYLKKKEEARLRQGHLWVFSNEIDVQRSPLSGFSPGDLALVHSHDGKALGVAYVNPATLIAARLLTRHCHCAIDTAFFKARLAAALALRERFFERPYYRLVFGESDGLPGLVVDRFDTVLVVQINTAGMERQRPALLSALHSLLAPQAIVLKHSAGQRQLEGLDDAMEVCHGTLPTPLIIEENGARFKLDIVAGQKTGWFYDHRLSRAGAAQLAQGKRVLDLFCYTGAWAVPAALAGASEVTAVDSSAAALALLAENATLNGVGDKLHGVRSDVFEFLKEARGEQRHYDVVILDPPALIKRKKDFKAGFEAYRRLNHLALQVLAPGGVLVSASCSQHLRREQLQDILRSSARHIDRHLQIFAQGGQGPDHPLHPAIPESEYLKTFFCAVSPSL